MAIKTKLETYEEYINTLNYEIIKREITQRDITQQMIILTNDPKTNAELMKVETQLKNEIAFMNKLLTLATEEYNKLNTKIG